MLQPREAVCLLVLSFTLLSSTYGGKTCPQGWYGYQNTCYFFSAATASWGTAKSICATRGGKLATLNTVGEANWISSQCKKIANGKNYHVGATDQGTEGKWRNVDNSKFPTDKRIWAKGQPDNYNKKEHCGQYGGWNNYALNDAPCGPPANYICERSIDYADPCDSVNGWHLVNGKCYRYFKEPARWSAARDTCQKADGDLITVNSNQELSLVSESVSCDNSGSIWLGYSDVNPTQVLQWVDGAKSSLTKWDTKGGEPNMNIAPKGKRCAASITQNKNLWELINCDGSNMGYICEKAKGQCPVGWTRIKGQCTRTFYNRLTWPAAKATCEGYGGTLATTQQLGQTGRIGAISSLFASFGKFWVGVSDRGQDGQFLDLNGQPRPFKTLAAQKPNKKTECGIFTSATAKVTLASCYSSSYYMCTASQGAVVATPTSAPSDGLRCYDGWTKYKGSCYKRSSKPANYNAAKADCVSKQATLLVVNDRDELDFLAADTRLMNSIVYIGLDDQKTEGTFSWIDGTPFTFKNWAPKEPNNHKGAEDCAEMQSYAFGDPLIWNDIPCTSNRNYICEAKAITGDQVTTPKPTRPWSPECGQGWSADLLSGKCYFFSLDQKNWKDARTACQKMQSDLISVSTKYEQTFIQGMLRADTFSALGYWSGGNDQDQEAGWKWTDGKPFAYFNWNDGEPNSNGNEDCIEIGRANGKWNDNNCNNKRNYICAKLSDKISTKSTQNTTPLPAISDDCKSVELISGDHWVPDSALKSSSVRDKDSGAENSRIDWAATDKLIKVNTPNKYSYKPIANLNLKGITTIRFSVQACNDAHISLQPAINNISRDAYEVVLGGWRNTQSVIRKEHQGSNQGLKKQQGVVDCNKANPFWITWKSGKIQVGTGFQVTGQTMLMEMAVAESLTIAGMAVTTGWGSTGVWTITNPHGTRKGAWSPKYAVKKGVPIGTEQFIYKEWIQVDFAKPTLIQSITTKGSATSAEYVVEYYIQYAYDQPYNFQSYTGLSASKTPKYLPGNKDQNTPVTNKLEAPFEAQFIRLVPRKFINYPSLRWAVNGCPPPKYCTPEALVSGETSIQDWAIRASSLKGSTPYDVRLNKLPGKADPKGWLASMPQSTDRTTLSEEWIQLNFQRDMLVYGIITKGHAEQNYWVKSYQIQIKSPSAAKYYFVNYQEPYGTVRTFVGNTDKNTAVTNMLANPVIATFIRILPKEFNTMVAMRVEVLGCLAGCQLSPMLNGPNKISDQRLKASSSSQNLLPSKARLDTSGFASAWSPKVAKTNQFFQVDFGITERIYAITTQGRGDKDEWVTRYRVAYSYNAKFFYRFQGTSTLPGNVDRNTKNKNFLKSVIKARAIRIYPVKWNKKPSMRVEIYGCSGSTTKSLGCFTEGTQADSFDGPSSYILYNGPAKCAASCFKDGYMYAALNRESCKCGSNLPIGGESRRCNYKCKANNNFFCGGYSAGVVSIYETGRGPDDERCPSGYDTFNDKCYKVNKIKESWQDARRRCMVDGGDLATINNDAEQAYLKSHLNPLGVGLWIGLNDLNDQMSFSWADGTPVRATYWMHSEPNNWLGKNEDCVEAISYKEMAAGYKKLNPQNGLWNDRPCEEQRYSMCQKRKEKNLNPPTTVAPPKGCPFGWKAYGTSCYLMIEHASTWGLASYTCRKEGGTLVRVNDDFEQNFLTTELFSRDGYKSSARKTLYWTDLKINVAKQEFTWSNKWDVIPYTHWSKGEPPAPVKGAKANQKCVALNGKNEKPTGYWMTQYCSSGAFPLCERPRLGFKQPALPTLAPQDIPCPQDWLPVGPSCYQVNRPADPVDMKTWGSAQQHCQKQGANLAFINNATENDALWRTYLLQPGVDSSITSRFWIGLNDRARNKGYEWVSGDAFSYSNWKAGEPNDWDGLEPCVMLDGANGQWNDEKCVLPMNWVCSVLRTKKKDIIKVVTTPEPTPGATGSCPDGDDWKYFMGHCYYVNKDLLTFREANTYCNSKGAHLVSITSNIENSFIRAQTKSLISNFTLRSGARNQAGSVNTQVWTGLNEIDRSKGHRWSDNSPYKYTNWAANEPNDWNGGEYCVVMLPTSGEWNDVHCSARIVSVCEKNPSQSGPITTTMSPHIDGYCPTGYVGFENDCYRIEVNAKANWTTAEFTCGTEGGHLAYILNSREQTFMTAQLNVAKKAGTALWIGMKHGSQAKSEYFSHDTSYLWSANKDVTYTNWNHGEPNGLNKEGCAEMLFNPAGRWNDVACPSERGYVCKKPKDGTVKTPPVEDNSKCQSPGYKYWNEGCYKLVTSKGTWDYLDGNTCGGDGAHLVSIQDPYEYSFIRQWMWQEKVQEDIWIGLKSEAASKSFSWSNTWPVVVTYWGQNEPSQFMNEEGCVVMNSGMGEDDGKWKHTTCREMHSTICKKPLTPPPFPPPQSGICRSAAGENWIANADGYCYLFNIDPRYTFDDAESACRTAGANLASLHSDADTSFVTTQLEHMDVVGGNGGTKNVWIGLKKEQSGAFVWTDNSAVFYANWADSEPNSVESNEKCTELYSPNSDWNDVDCQSKRGFICKIKQGQQPATFPTPQNTPPTTSLTTKKFSLCQLDGWKFYNGSCYLMVSQPNEYLRWNEAMSYCSAAGREAHLVSIGSEEENQWIVENLVPTGIQGDAWTGFGELRTDNRFSWIDRSPITYVNWASGQPKTNTGSMECVAMVVDGGGAAGRWSTEYCFSKKAFICEIDSTKQLQVTVATPFTDGSLCAFPFIYRGQEYNTCTTYGHDTFLWCATSRNYDLDRKFAICDPFKCPPGWRRHQRLCYYFSQATDKKSWLDAEGACAAQSADLAFIGTGAVQSFITNNINEYFWIGINDRVTEGRMVWDHRPNMVMRRGFTNWGINEPRSIFGTEDCTQTVNGPYADGRPGEWVMANCDLARRYICMKDAEYTLGPKTVPPTITAASTPSVNAGSSSPAVNYQSSTKPSIGGAANTPQKQSATKGDDDDMSNLRTGEITAIVIACVAVVLAGVFIVLYLIKSRQTQANGSFKDLGFENASYSRSNDSVRVGLENPNFSSN